MKRREAMVSLSSIGAGAFALPDLSIAGRKANKPLSLQYVDRVSKMIERIGSTESDTMLEAAGHIARTYKNGGTCFCQWETGHSFDGDMFPNRQAEPAVFVMGYTMGNPGVEPKSGDLLLASVLRRPLEDPREKGIFVIGGPTPWCGDTENPELLTERNKNLVIKPYSDLWIETNIPTLGALMWLPGETAPLGPTSGALGMVTFWAMLADAVRLLARDNISVPVKGDEPQLDDRAPYVSLNRPLGDDYLTESLRQIGQIRAEYGTIKSIAAAAADKILSGGKLWVYSRYHEALSAEASGKRGGLALINTTDAEDEEFDGGKNDFMIMGIYQPDDEIDMDMLKKFRKAGMPVAAIGPATRSGAVPKDSTVPKEADYHLGAMCDTYGLFAIPGVERKVCPTSGLLVNLLFWTTMIELAGEIMRRTGNTPGVLSTGAVIGGGDQRRRRTEMYRQRGY